MDIIYGVSVGDYAKGLYLRAYRQGLLAGFEETITLETFEAYMLRCDDHVYDATPEEWTEAYAQFLAGIVAFHTEQQKETE